MGQLKVCGLERAGLAVVIRGADMATIPFRKRNAIVKKTEFQVRSLNKSTLNPLNPLNPLNFYSFSKKNTKIFLQFIYFILL